MENTRENYNTLNNESAREMSLREKREAYHKERAERLQNREFNYIKQSLKRDLSGRPTVPEGDLTVFGLLGKFVGKTVAVVLVIVLIIMSLLSSLLIGIMVGYISTATEVPSSLFTISEQTSYLYDAKGKQIAALTGGNNINREVVEYQEISNTYIDEAFMAIEDRTFETNIGIDPRRIAGAVISTLTNAGESSYGGSTITQQTVKMLTGDDEVSYQRKVQEWYRAVRLTEQLSKAEIMSLYLNLVPMGNSYVGIQTAAKAYFGKEAKDLNLAECALLAGIPKSPASYNPRTELGRKNAQRRQRVVLSSMLEVGFITADEFEQSINYELKYHDAEPEISSTDILSYFAEFAIEQVTSDLIKAGYSKQVASNMVQNGGLQIFSTLDPEAQNKLDELFLDARNFQSNPAAFINQPEVPQSGMVILDNKENTIVAMQGGYGEKEANLVLNRATDITRQPGSAFKPLASYAPAIELDLITGATIVKDQPVALNLSDPAKLWPQNAYLSYYGNITVREALKISSNVPAVKLLHEVGVDTSKSYLKQMGIDLSNDPASLSIGIGSLGYGVSPLQMANAFQTFTNGGLYAEAKAYSKVLDSNGNVLLENDPKFEQVFSPETSYMMIKLMEEVWRAPRNGVRFRGTLAHLSPFTNANGESIATAGKTGTTDDFQDEWGVMLSPYYTLATWFGFDNRIKRSVLSTYDYLNIHNVSVKILDFMHADKEEADWVQPAGIIELDINPYTGFVANKGASYKFTEYFKANSEITPSRRSPNDKDSPSINYLKTDAISNYYRNFAYNGGYQ